MYIQAELLNSKLRQDWLEMSQHVQADVSARMAALHNHISSVGSTHALASGSVNDGDHVTSPRGHVTMSEENKAQIVSFLKIIMNILVMYIVESYYLVDVYRL